MSHPSPAIPPPLHREAKPVRSCTGCGTWLASANETTTCWQCEPTWSKAEAHFAQRLRDELGEVLDQILATA